MKFACALSALCVVLTFGGAALAESYSPSCEIAVEKIDTARKALVPFRRPIEMARAHEYGANGKAAACIGSGPDGVDKPFRCHPNGRLHPRPRTIRRQSTSTTGHGQRLVIFALNE